MLKELCAVLELDYKETKAWFVCLSAGLFFFYDFIQLNMFNTLNTYIAEAFRLDAVEIGYLSSTYLFATVCMLPFCGALLDRISTRKIILTAMSVCTFSTLLFSLADSLWMAALARFICGASTAFCFLSCIVLSTRWFPSEKMAQVTGVIVTMAMLGGALSQEPLAHLIGYFGWRQALQLDTLLGIVLWVFMYFAIEDHPQDQAPPKPNNEPVIMSYSAAFQNKQNILCGLYTSLMNLFIFVFGAAWGVNYLHHIYHFDLTTASRITTMLFFGTIVGSPLVGYFSDNLKQRRLPMILGAVVSFLLAAFLFMGPYLSTNGPMLSANQFAILFFVIGLTTSTQIISYPVIYESNPPSITGASEGLASVLIMGGGALFQSFFGWVMKQHWNGLMVDGLPKYSGGDYHLAYVTLPVTLLICILLARRIKETNCNPIWRTTSKTG